MESQARAAATALMAELYQLAHDVPDHSLDALLRQSDEISILVQRITSDEAVMSSLEMEEVILIHRLAQQLQELSWKGKVLTESQLVKLDRARHKGRRKKPSIDWEEIKRRASEANFITPSLVLIADMRDVLRTPKSLRKRGRRRKPTYEERTTPCECCGYPLSQRHHLLEVAKFGENDVTAMLCCNCHDLFHIMANETIRRVGSIDFQGSHVLIAKVLEAHSDRVSWMRRLFEQLDAELWAAELGTLDGVSS